MAVGTGEARAWSNTYCGVTLSHSSWCGDGSNHTYDDNKAIGSSSAYVCERLLWADTPYPVANPTCAWGSRYKPYGTNTSWLYEAEVTHQTPGGGRFTVTGVAVA